MNPITCTQAETLLTDYLDNTLAEPQALMMDAHMASCEACGALVDDMRLAMRYAAATKEVEPPAELISRIIEQTTGQAPAGVPEWRYRLAGWWDWTRLTILCPMLEPRFAMGMAMTVISFSMVGHFLGLDVRQVKLSDLEPVNIVHNVKNGVYVAGGKVSKYYYNLRVVYEIQTQLQEMRDSRAEAPEPTPAPVKQQETQPKKPAMKPNNSSEYRRDRNIEQSTEEAD
jgi:hypothetical protein